MNRAADEDIRMTPKAVLSDTARSGAANGAPRSPGCPGAARFGERYRARYRRLARPLAWWVLGVWALGTLAAPRGDAPGAFGASVEAPRAALPADLHGALREPIAADVVPPPTARADGFRILAGFRFPDLRTQGVHAARSLTRLTLAGDTAAVLYRGADECDFTLGVAPVSLAGMLMFTGEPPAHADTMGGPRHFVSLVMGFEPTVRLRVWSAHDTVWVASSDTLGPARFAALADLAAQGTNATSVPASLVHVAHAGGPSAGAPCGAG